MDSKTSSLHQNSRKRIGILQSKKLSWQVEEWNFYEFLCLSLQKEMPGIISETKIMISNEESSRMGQANLVTQRLFSLIDTISSTKSSVSHENWEAQRKKLMQELSASQQQIQLLSQQWTDHVCWNGQNQSKQPEDISR